jgi:hypothetical protein
VTDAVLLSLGYKLVQSTDAMHRLKIPERPSVIHHSSDATAISEEINDLRQIPGFGIRPFGAVPPAS